VLESAVSKKKDKKLIPKMPKSFSISAFSKEFRENKYFFNG